MKKLSVIIITAALALGLTQCKKTVETVTTSPNNHDGVFITVNASFASKHNVVTTTGSHYGEVNFSNGDKMMVGNGGKNVGTLTYNGESFTGTIGTEVELTTDDKLHFYFTGGLEPVVSFEYDEENYYAYEITDQSENLPVFSYGCSSINYDSEVNTYSAFLYNKCALVKFNLPENTTGDVKVSGMHSVVLLCFNNSLDNIFEPQEDLGSITLNIRGENEGWAILFPQDAVDGATVMLNGNWYTNAVDVPAIENNDLIDNLTISASTPYTPVFSVGPNEAVLFSPGNLQYQANSTNAPEPPYTGVWRFAEHQWDYVGGETGGSESTHYGTVNGSSNNYASSSYDGWIDLYMWGTSGWKYFDDDYCKLYKPWSQRTPEPYNYDVNVYGIGPSLGSDVGSDLNGTEYDWGVHNDIYNPTTNSTDAAGTWRTPTYEEMSYMLEGRPNAAKLVGYGVINDVNGLILLPDGCPIPDGLTFSSDLTDENEYDATEWSQMEGVGAVFLPCAGTYRDLSDGMDENEVGAYWTATHYGHGSGSSKDEFAPSAKAYDWEFEINEELYVDPEYRYKHCSVRLVKDVQ